MAELMYPALPSKRCQSLGIAVLVLGIAAIVVDFVLLFTYGTYLQGIWGGVFPLVLGAMAIPTSASKTRGLVVGCSVMAIISCVSCAVGMVFGFILAGANAGNVGGMILAILSGVILLSAMGTSIPMSSLFVPFACGSASSQTTMTGTVTYQTDQGVVVVNQQQQLATIAVGPNKATHELTFSGPEVNKY